jgi:hypothetical protein
MTDRRVLCWGADQVNFGRGAAETDLTPRPAGGGSTFQAISVGQIHVCGLDTGGRLRCWGDTILGALGIR